VDLYEVEKMNNFKGIRNGLVCVYHYSKPALLGIAVVTVLITTVLNQYSWGQCEGCTEDDLTIIEQSCDKTFVYPPGLEGGISLYDQRYCCSCPLGPNGG
jgi:hypothetical protein